MSKLQQLKSSGFDLTTHIAFTRNYRIACSQCQALAINGVPCHELGCPNEPRECEECGCAIESHHRHCQDCNEAIYG